MAAQIAIVLGAGKRIGAHSVETFKSNGFRVVRVSRSVEDQELDDMLSIRCDLSRPSSVSDVFEKVRNTWGQPSVVIYNAFAWHATKPEESFSIETEAFAEDLAINHTSAFVAAQEAITSFRALPSATPKTFIYTGNILNEGPIPGFLSLGTGKIASAHMMALGDLLHKDQNIRFFFVDERNADGTPALAEYGFQAHADIFLSLVERTAGEVPWQVTFVQGKGYVEFPRKIILPEDKSLYTVFTV